MATRTRKKKKKKSTRQIRLKPANSFDLIRLLARSQHDPRKAICELVQNSLDAGANRIEITWFNEKSRRAARILDDGQGVFPDLPREEALRRIATTIGHSHKRSLTPLERRGLMLLGKYGIGLLGFWSVGEVMEIRSRVGGGEVWSLRLVEDRPTAEIRKVPRSRLMDLETYTEVTVRMIHEGAARQIRPGRLRAYLAGELRGQLLRRDVELSIHDRVARGRAPKHFIVKPERFLGRALEDLRTLPVPGHEDAAVELYLLAPEDERAGKVALSCGGSKVADDLSWIDGSDSPRSPWSSGRVEGIVDFPELEVAPGTRRGFQLNRAALAFLDALGELEAELEARIASEDRRREEQRNRNLARQIRKAFLPVARALPEYDLLEVRAGEAARGPEPEAGAPVESAESTAATESPAGEPAPEEPPPGDDVTDDGALFPPGPLASVRISPRRSLLPPGACRTLRARALDGDQRAVRGEVRFLWRLEGPGEFTADGVQGSYRAPSFSANARITVCATQGDATVEAEAEIRVDEDLTGTDKGRGIPEPQPVHAPEQPWRSRLRDGRWEYNEAHRDHLAVAGNESARLRYLIHLFAKELVLQNFGGPGDERVLERMVEVLTHMHRPPARAQASGGGRGGEAG